MSPQTSSSSWMVVWKILNSVRSISDRNARVFEDACWFVTTCAVKTFRVLVRDQT